MPTLIISCHSISVEKYKGDGRLYKVGSFSVSHGYKIDFGEFDLSKKIEEEKVLQHYPKIEKEYMVGLHIESGSDTLNSDFDSFLSLKMVTSKGDILFDCSGNMSSWRWSRSVGDNKENHKYFIYYMDDRCESGFSFTEIPMENSTLYLYVDYVPSETQGNTSELLTGSVQLQVGGYK